MLDAELARLLLLIIGAMAVIAFGGVNEQA
jgi:hypothetical protein